MKAFFKLYLEVQDKRPYEISCIILLNHLNLKTFHIFSWTKGIGLTVRLWRDEKILVLSYLCGYMLIFLKYCSESMTIIKVEIILLQARYKSDIFYSKQLDWCYSSAIVQHITGKSTVLFKYNLKILNPKLNVCLTHTLYVQCH